MFNFFKGSIRELKHVVWPSNDETKKYFTIVLTVLIVFWLYLFLASSLFSQVLFFLKNTIWPNKIETNIPNIDLNSIKINTGVLNDTWSLINTWTVINTWSLIDTWIIVK